LLFSGFADDGNDSDEYSPSQAMIITKRMEIKRITLMIIITDLGCRNNRASTFTSPYMVSPVWVSLPIARHYFRLLM